MWGQSLIGDFTAAPVRMLMQLLLARLWLRRLPCSFPRLTGPCPLMSLLGHAWGASSRCTGSENLSFQSPATAPRGCGTGASDGAIFPHRVTGAPVA
jgi:hypothetical protein